MKILAFAGSARTESLNKKLAAAVAGKARTLGAEVTLIDLANYPLPLYDGDLEAGDGLPENAIKLKQLFVEHDALIIATPEYNSSISPLLKNTIDWISRPHSEDEPRLVAYVNKTAALVACSPGPLGGLRGLNHVRDILFNIGVNVLPGFVAVGYGTKGFDEHGALTDASANARIDALLERLVLND